MPLGFTTYTDATLTPPGRVNNRSLFAMAATQSVVTWNDGTNTLAAVFSHPAGGSGGFGATTTLAGQRGSLANSVPGAALDATRFVMLLNASAVVGSVSGTTITFGTPVANTGGTYGGAQWALSSTLAVALYYQTPGLVASTAGIGSGTTVSSADGSLSTGLTDVSQIYSGVVVDSSHLLITYFDTATPQNLRAAVLTCSAGSVTAGTPVTLVASVASTSDTGYEPYSAWPLGAGKFLMPIQYGSGFNFWTITVSGTSITAHSVDSTVPGQTNQGDFPSYDTSGFVLFDQASTTGGWDVYPLTAGTLGTDLGNVTPPGGARIGYSVASAPHRFVYLSLTDLRCLDIGITGLPGAGMFLGVNTIRIN